MQPETKSHRLEHHGGQKGSLVISEKSFKSRWTWKTAAIVIGMKIAVAAFVLGLAHTGLLPDWMPRL